MSLENSIDTNKETRSARNIGVGCFTFFIGGASGAMSGVLVGKILQFFQRAPECGEMPVCDWHVFAGWGALVGAITLPILALWRLLRADRRADSQSRG